MANRLFRKKVTARRIADRELKNLRADDDEKLDELLADAGKISPAELAERKRLKTKVKKK